MPTIAPATTMGSVHLTVADLDRSLTFYREVVGLRVLEHHSGRASVGAGEHELLALVEEPGARPATGHTGLFHFALRVPDRVALARWLAHAGRERLRLQGLADHFVSEAIYLADPDAHGIEIYWDRPRELWEGKVESHMTTAPLDVDDLLGELRGPDVEPFEGLPRATDMGHVHLRVANVTPAIEFYRDVLGFELMAALGPQAAFFGAGGYHHHIGANSWQSRGAPPPPPGTAALRHATVVLPTAAERERVIARVPGSGQEPGADGAGALVRDPSGNSLVLTAP